MLLNFPGTHVGAVVGFLRHCVGSFVIRCTYHGSTGLSTGSEWCLQIFLTQVDQCLQPRAGPIPVERGQYCECVWPQPIRGDLPVCLRGKVRWPYAREVVSFDAGIFSIVAG